MATQLRTTTEPVSVRKLTVDEVIGMGEAGIISGDERVELHDGVLITMSPESRPHAFIVENLTTRLAHLYVEYVAASQTMQPLGEYTFVHPDVRVLKNVSRDEWPRPDQVVVIVEVAYTSLTSDLTSKALDYAAWGAATYWVVDVNNQAVIVHTDPTPDGYATVRTYRHADTVPLPELDTPLPVATILGLDT